MMGREFDGAPQHRVSAGVFLLYLGADCEQHCVFCALKTYQPPADRGETELAALLQQARDARARGIDHLQLEGIDPPQFSRILELVAGLTALGFTSLTVTGTARRFADPAFVAAFFARAPRATVVVAPLYGVTPAVHDAVTGRVGSFVEVRAAIDHLHAVRGGGCLAITTVPTGANLGELAQIIELGVARGIPVRGRLPYPLRRAGIDAYRAAAVRERELVERFATALRRVARPHRARVAQAFRDMLQHPCTLAPVARRWRNAALRPAPSERWRLEGVEARTTAVATVACPHVAACALAARCPGAHYEAYASHFGLDEFTPPAARRGF